MNFKQEALLNWFIKDHGGEQGSTRFQGSEIQGSETSEIAEDLTASLLEYIKTTSEGGGGDHTKYRLFFMRLIKQLFSKFSCFEIPTFFSNLNLNCSNLSDMRNLQEQVKKAFCYQKLF